MRYYNKRKIDLRKLRDFVPKNKAVIGVGLAVALGVSIANFNEQEKTVTTIVQTVDNEKDDYQGEIPLYGNEEDKEVIATIDESILGLVEGKVEYKKIYKISIMDSDANIQEGYVEGKYLKTLLTLENDEAEKYTKIYAVTPEAGVNIRKSTKITDSNKIMSIAKDEYVLGSDTYEASKDNTFSWVPIIYMNEGEAVEGYIARDFLKEVDREKEPMLVDTTTDGKVPLNLREEPSKEAKIIEKIENGSEVYIVSSSEEKEKDGITWREVEFVDEETKEVKNGWVSSEFLKSIEEKTKDEEDTERDNTQKDSKKEENENKMLKVDTSHVGGIDLNVRKGIGSNTQKIGSIPNGSEIILLGESGDITEDSWVQVAYIDKDTDEQKQGWVSTAYLKEIEETLKKQVDTSRDGDVDLKLRKEPSLDGKVEVKIPNGTVLTVTKEALENTINVDNYEWIQVQLEDGTKGYVAQEYLVEYEEDKENENEEFTIDGNSDNVIGIDVSTISTQTLDQLLKGEIKIPNNIDTVNLGTLDLSKYENKEIKYVYLKLGSTGYGNTFSFVDFENYKELAKVCEENKIPYGFYYYSTCINNEEARKEAKRIEMLMNSLDKREYNILPLAIDIELHQPDDRQKNQDITELTKVKAYLTNLVESTQGKTILYTSRNVIEAPETKIMDLSDYNELIESGESDVWFVAPEGNSTHRKSLDNILTTEDAEVKMKQVVQDGVLPTGEGYDVNVMKKDMYIEYTKANETEQIENMQEQEVER